MHIMLILISTAFQHFVLIHVKHMHQTRATDTKKKTLKIISISYSELLTLRCLLGLYVGNEMRKKNHQPTTNSISSKNTVTIDTNMNLLCTMCIIQLLISNLLCSYTLCFVFLISIQIIIENKNIESRVYKYECDNNDS